MLLLSYEAVVACARMTPAERAKWLSEGGKIVHRGGKRQWRAAKG
jgi:hypothetical protein